MLVMVYFSITIGQKVTWCDQQVQLVVSYKIEFMLVLIALGVAVMVVVVSTVIRLVLY